MTARVAVIRGIWAGAALVSIAGVGSAQLAQGIASDPSGLLERAESAEVDRPAATPDNRCGATSSIWASFACAWLPTAAAAQEVPEPVRVCLAPARAEMASGNTAAAVEAVREAFTSFLSGPSITTSPLTARLASQAREEAQAAKCPFTVYPFVKHSRKEGGGTFGRIAGSAIESGSGYVAGSSGSVLGRAAGGAAQGVARATAREVASPVRAKDELKLEYRLEDAAGRTIAEKSAKRKAESDGEDLLTPLVEQAAEAITAAVRKG